LIDHGDAAKEISDIAKINKKTITVYIDLNVGMNRTGITPGLEALQLYIDCTLLPNLNPVGLHAYDGHIHDIDLSIRAERCQSSFESVLKMQQDLKHKGYPEPQIIAGGSPTFAFHAKRKNIECSPGTFVYWDKGYQLSIPEQEFLPAALVITRVISMPDKTKLCLDLGHKSVSAENEINKRVYFLNATELLPVAHSEEHLIVEAGKGHGYKIGDLFYGLPYHVCPTVALYERAYVIQEQRFNSEWLNAARDRKITT